MAGEMGLENKEMRNAYKILVREPEWKRSLWRHKRKLKDNIEMDFKETGY